MKTIIPNSLDLTYSKHAIRERTRDKFGFIEQVPCKFFKMGCKSVEPIENKKIKVRYIYDDNLDLVLIVDDGFVITNYLVHSNNKGKYKGRFRIKTIIKDYA